MPEQKTKNRKEKLMKTMILIFTLLALNANAENVTCTGVTNDPNMTPLNFELQITGKPDKDFPSQTSYKSIIRYTMPDGSHRSNGIDLNEKPHSRLNKIIYGGLTATLELTFSASGSLQSSILNSPLSAFHMLPINCSIQGKIFDRPMCAKETELDKSLQKAIALQDIDLAETAIECGANVNNADKNGCTPLMFAIDENCGAHGNLSYVSSIYNPQKMMDSLIGAGAFVNIKDGKNETPLIKAAKLDISDVYDSFIASEADFDAQDNQGNTALMYAAMNGSTGVTSQILEGNPDRRLKNKLGQTAFDIAKVRQKESIINLVRIPDLTVTIEGQADGSCLPLTIEIAQGKVVEFALKATGEKMFKFDSSALNLNLMADTGRTAKQVTTADTVGRFTFTCGFHGSNAAKQGEIIIK